jgi:hypothetical protein
VWRSGIIRSYSVKQTSRPLPPFPLFPQPVVYASLTGQFGNTVVERHPLVPVADGGADPGLVLANVLFRTAVPVDIESVPIDELIRFRVDFEGERQSWGKDVRIVQGATETDRLHNS